MGSERWIRDSIMRAAGFKNRTHYFDSRKGVRVHIENVMHEATEAEPAESGGPEVIDKPEEPMGDDIEGRAAAFAVALIPI